MLCSFLHIQVKVGEFTRMTNKDVACVGVTVVIWNVIWFE